MSQRHLVFKNDTGKVVGFDWNSLNQTQATGDVGRVISESLIGADLCYSGSQRRSPDILLNLNLIIRAHITPFNFSFSKISLITCLFLHF